MENQEITFKMALKSGLIIGGISIAISLVLWATISDVQLRNKFGYATYFILALLYHFYTKSYRDNSLDGAISYGKAFTFMFYITIATSLLYMVYMYVLFNFLDPGMIDVIKEQAAEKLYQSSGLTDEQIEQAVEMQSMWVNSTMMTISGFFGSLIFGTILSLIVAIFVKKDLQIIED